MTEGVPEDAAAARAAEQARLRKERREAKIKAGGASRLNKISGLAGGVPKETEQIPAAAAAPTPRQQQPLQQTHADPEEVDISQHYYQPQATVRIPTPQQQQQADLNVSEEQLRQMMLGLDMPGMNAAGGAGPGGNMMEGDFMRMMMQNLMGGGGGGMPGMPGAEGGTSSPFPFLFPGGAAGGAGGMPPFPGMPPPPEMAGSAVIPDRYASLWRLLHTAVALALGLYIALWTQFSGTKLDRDKSAAIVNVSEGLTSSDTARRFFWAFATAEALLLTTRFFMDRGRQAPQQGLLGMVVGFLPGKIGSYVRIGLQYGQIFSTVRADILVCVFVLGVCSHLRS
ncbi:hypothetical protein B0H66DRAFT_564009 [Apodospora peruviana]|uniref:Uncharacterized protein n=1 Tax=Apodospora peruviana TaxID=516989 RepID=A0AAE0HY03_9PEZI|nr:hypothetical protein B0H66DRAFT_564009 [Apodospora peruviana]